MDHAGSPARRIWPVLFKTNRGTIGVGSCPGVQDATVVRKAGGQKESTSSTLQERNKGMSNWCRDKLEWAVIKLFQLVMPLFLFFCVANTFANSCGENGAEWSVRVQNDRTLPAMPAFTCRFALSPTIHHTFCGSNW